jgi:hypothetical protein
MGDRMSNNFWRAVATIIACVGLTACMKPRSADVDVVGGTFAVMEITGPSATTVQFDSWGFPMVKQYSYKICLQDAVTKSSIKGQPFYITIGDAQVPGAQVTDQGGCMVVVDPLKIGFNILAQENFLSRTIFKPRALVSAVMQKESWLLTPGPTFLGLARMKLSI